jgi:alkanesulfonate monooxygenase SsuD/methylene tetrahydromethanopterin reductase-like flavin-dependent oxidoreductase (luciferase family)
MSVKVIVQVYPMIAAADEEERTRLRPLGRNVERYQAAIREWADIAQAAEDLGYWGISTIEHHFHSEGYEVGPSPGPICSYLAGQTSRINIGALGYVMSTQDAIRVAEECAVIDHLTRGRFWAGFSRGYQSRWTNIIGQHIGGVATASDGGAADQQNRMVFEEQVELVLRAWTEDSLDFKGNAIQVPYPYETGVSGYPAADTARELGAPGEIDDEGNVRRISVVPQPYQDPHPPVHVAVTGSIDSVRFCARKGFNVAMFSPIEKMEEHARIYVEESNLTGFPVEFGQNINSVRWAHVADSAAEFDRMLERWDAEIFVKFYAKFFKEKLPVGADRLQSVKSSGLWLGGTPDDAIKAFRREWDILPSEYLTLIYHWPHQSTADTIRDLERMAKEVLPALGGMTPPEVRGTLRPVSTKAGSGS